MDRGAWQTMVHEVAKSWTRLNNYHFHFLESVCVCVCVCVCVGGGEGEARVQNELLKTPGAVVSSQ